MSNHLLSQLLNIINNLKNTVIEMPRSNQRRNGMHRWIPKQNIVPAKKESKPPKFEKIKEINIDRLVPNPNQPRKEFGDVNKINELAKSIKQEGLIQPIIVRKKKNKFEIIVGERRWRACKATVLIRYRQ